MKTDLFLISQLYIFVTYAYMKVTVFLKCTQNKIKMVINDKINNNYIWQKNQYGNVWKICI